MIDHSPWCPAMPCVCAPRTVNADESFWDGLPVWDVDTDKLVWDTNGVVWDYVRHLATEPNRNPIRVQELYDGRFYVLNGRHRVVRAILDNESRILAHVIPFSDEHLGRGQ